MLLLKLDSVLFVTALKHIATIKNSHFPNALNLTCFPVFPALQLFQISCSAFSCREFLMSPCVFVRACEQALIVQRYYTETHRHHYHQLNNIVSSSSRSALTWPVTIADRTVQVTRISTDTEDISGLHKRLPLRTGNVLGSELSSLYLQFWIVTTIKVVWHYCLSGRIRD